MKAFLLLFLAAQIFFQSEGTSRVDAPRKFFRDRDRSSVSRKLSACSCLAYGVENEAFCESGKFVDPESCSANTGRCHWGPGENPACAAMPSSAGSDTTNSSPKSSGTVGIFAEQWRGASNGYDYFTGEYSTYEIFDVSELGSNTISISLETKSGSAENVNIQIPKGIAWTKKAEGQFDSSIKTFTDLSDYSTQQGDSYSKTWSESGTMTAKMKAKKTPGKKLGSPMPSATASFETGGSLNHEYMQSLKYMQAKSSTIITTNAKIVIGTVQIETIIGQKLKQHFVNELAALPKEPWDQLDKGEKDYYMELFGDFGSHYVQQAELGGEFHHEIRSNDCYTNMKMDTASDFKSCAEKKIGIGVNDIPFKGALLGGSYSASSQTCQGLTSTGTAQGEWAVSELEEVCRMSGGGLATQCQITEGLGKWIDAVKQTPHSTPAKIAELPRLLQKFHDNFEKEMCVPCQQLKKQHLSREQMKIIVDNLDEALLEHFLAKFEEKSKAESECNIFCGPCQDPAGPGCKCPEDENFCDNNQNDKMIVKIDRVEAYFPNAEDVSQTTLWVRGLPGITTAAGTSDNGFSISAQIGYNSADKAVHSTGTLDSIPIEVSDYHDGALRDTMFGGDSNECIGSVVYPMDKICPDNFYSWLPWSSGKGTIALTGKCSNSNGSPKGGKVVVIGTIEYPNKCVRNSPCEDMSAHMREKAIWIALGSVAGLIVIGFAAYLCYLRRKSKR